jgi:hypothetical protein
MKKPFVLIAAIAAVVCFGAAVALAKETTEVGTAMTLQYRYPHAAAPDHPGSFVGTVKGRKGCQTGRTVILTAGAYRGPVEDDAGRTVGSDKSNNRGKYKIIWPAYHFAELHYYRAVAEKRKITKSNGDRIVCERGRSLVIGGLYP